MSKKLVLNGKEIETCDNNEFINATKLSIIGNGKLINEWYNLDSSKILVKNIEHELKLAPIVDVLVGGLGPDWVHTWIHIDLLGSFVEWVNPKCTKMALQWVEKQKGFTVNKNTERTLKERSILLYINDIYKGVIVVKTAIGSIDLVTKSQIIQIGNEKNWKEIIGKLLCYSKFYPTKQKCIYIYGSIDDIQKKYLENTCSEYSILILYEK